MLVLATLLGGAAQARVSLGWVFWYLVFQDRYFFVLESIYMSR